MDKPEFWSVISIFFLGISLGLCIAGLMGASYFHSGVVTQQTRLRLECLDTESGLTFWAESSTLILSADEKFLTFAGQQVALSGRHCYMFPAER